MSCRILRTAERISRFIKWLMYEFYVTENAKALLSDTFFCCFIKQMDASLINVKEYVAVSCGIGL